MFAYNNEVTATPCEPGVSRKVLTYSEELMMCEITFEKGAKGNFHQHEHLQITYIAEGSFEFTVNVNRLRKKLDNAGLKDFIGTKFGVGYIVQAD